MLTTKLREIPPGREGAKDYQLHVLEILNFLFNPDLTDGRPEVRTFEGTERWDILFTNESDESFWTYVRNSHDGILVMFEAKTCRSWIWRRSIRPPLISGIASGDWA